MTYELKVLVTVKEMEGEVVSTRQEDIDQTLIEWLDDMITVFAENHPHSWRYTNFESVKFTRKDTK